MQVAVFGDVKAEGICGSGIVDAIAAMLDAGVLDETGCILEDGHAFEGQVREIDGQPAFVLPGTQVEITQKDVRAVQLAKSAIHAGMITLLQEAGIAPEKVKNMLIAGGFGSCIRPRSAERIGLIPKGFAEKAVSLEMQLGRVPL